MPIEVEKMRFNQYYVTSLFGEVVQEAFNKEPPSPHLSPPLPIIIPLLLSTTVQPKCRQCPHISLCDLNLLINFVSVPVTAL